MAAPITPAAETATNWFANLPIIGDFLGAVAPYDPSRYSWTAPGQERLREEMNRAGLSIPFQQWALANVPVVWRRGGEGALGSYMPPGPLPPAVTQALRPWASNPLMPVPGTVQLYGGAAPGDLAHELLHAYWARQMAAPERTQFLQAAQALAELPTAAPEREAEALQLLHDYFGDTPARMRSSPTLATGVGPLATLLPPAPTELHAYLGALGAGSLENLPPTLRPFYAPLYAVG